MKNTVLKFGALSGVVVIVLMSINTIFAEQIGFDRAVVAGYTVIVISFLFVYFGMRSYRDDVLGGQISFGKGFNIGILITLITCFFYVAGWLVLFYNFMPDFGEKYAAYIVESLRTKGASEAEIAAAVTQGQESLLASHFQGLLVTLVSAAVLRTKAP